MLRDVKSIYYHDTVPNVSHFLFNVTYNCVFETKILTKILIEIY